MAMQFCSFDQAYVERLRSGDLPTQQHFVDYFGSLVRMKLRKRLRSPIIEDLWQETFTRVWAALQEQEGIRHPERLGAFVNSVCNNVLLEYYRRASRDRPSEPDAENSIPDLSIDVVDAIAIRQEQEDVRQLLRRLPDRERRLLEEVFVKERDREEVSKELGLSRNTLRVCLHRAKNSFRDLYWKSVSGSIERSSLKLSQDETPVRGTKVISLRAQSDDQDRSRRRCAGRGRTRARG